MTTTLKKRPARNTGARTNGSPGALARWTRWIEQALEAALPSGPDVPRPLEEALRYCVLGSGKRFRPLLVLSGCAAAGGRVREALPGACAVELVHAYSLVHDDLPSMDDADERRGRASCHRKYGEAVAVLVGDALLTLAFELLGRLRGARALEASRVLAEAGGTRGLIGGQVLDLQLISRPDSGHEAMLQDIARRKTAALIAASVEIGAVLGGASPETRRRLRRFGERVGVAFQMVDDAHDGDGYARLAGETAARAEAERLIAAAVGQVEPLGARGAALAGLANWLKEA
ncbi:MAG TPA: polyprenyl synthetase family protein [bacterium]